MQAPENRATSLYQWCDRREVTRPAAMMDTAAIIERALAELKADAPPDAPERLARFLSLMAKWNRSHNLTAITDPRAMVAKHVLDSLAGGPWVVGRRALDVGSGAGLPGIPLAVANPSREWVLLDSRGKRVQFLTYVKHDLGLENVTVVQARIEKYQGIGKFDTLTARAFAALPELVRLTTPFIQAGARLVVWTGSDPSAALADITDRQRLAGTAYPVRVPGVSGQRHIVTVERSA